MQYVVEGSVRRDAGRVRVTAQLVPGERPDAPLWAAEYDRDLKELARLVQSEIARGIAEEIQATLGKASPLTPLWRDRLIAFSRAV